MELLGYISAIVIGVTLGLMGGGGSILTVPVLVYLFGTTASVATGDSLFIVGATAAIGASLMARRGLVAGRAAIGFALPAFATVWLTRRFVLLAIPSHMGKISRDTLILVFFAALMLVTAISMLRGRNESSSDDGEASDFKKLALPALAVGVVTGLVGAGGGFLIVPALTLAAKLPMKRAVGTSLAIISANSLFGFFSDPLARGEANWTLLVSLTCLAALGMWLGNMLSQRIPGERLRPSFGIFLLVMGVYMVVREIFLPR
jgi:uncharacterized membrane protein YfcA